MTRHKTASVAALAAIAAIPLGLAGAHASGSKTQTLRIFEKPTATTLTEPRGKVISHPPYPQPSAGDVLDVYSWSTRAITFTTPGTGA